MFEALDHALVMALAERDAKTAGPESNVGEREDAIVSGLEAQIVGVAFHPGVRLRAFTMLKRSAISLGLLDSALYHPSCTSFSKLILVADQEDLLALLQ